MGVLNFANFFSTLALVASASYGGYGTTPDDKIEYYSYKEKLVSSLVAVEGIIYCKYGHTLVPLKGAIARISCVGTDGQGYETSPFSKLSNPADKKGCFLATLSSLELNYAGKQLQCKAFLDYSPLDTCKVPTDINNGTTGYVLSSFTLLQDKNTKLYSVGPFFYAPQPK